MKYISTLISILFISCMGGGNNVTHVKVIVYDTTRIKVTISDTTYNHKDSTIIDFDTTVVPKQVDSPYTVGVPVDSFYTVWNPIIQDTPVFVSVGIDKRLTPYLNKYYKDTSKLKIEVEVTIKDSTKKK